MSQISLSQCIELKSAPGFFLERNAARALDRACAKFGKRLILTGAWRAYAVQERLFRERYVYGDLRGRPGFTQDRRFWNGQPWTRKKGTAAAAVPGRSNHGSGRAIDVKTRRDRTDPPYSQAVIFGSWNDADRREFLRVAKDDGWAEDEGLSVDELWHITYYPARDKNRGAVAPVISIPKEEDEMTPEEKKTFAQMAEDSRVARVYATEALQRIKRIHPAVGGNQTRTRQIIDLLAEIDARVGRVGEQNTYSIGMERKVLDTLDKLREALNVEDEKEK